MNSSEILILNYLKNKNQIIDGNIEIPRNNNNKSYYINTNNSIKLHISSSVYKDIMFEIKTNPSFTEWNISKDDPQHKLLLKLMKEYNMLQIPTEKSKVESHIKNLIEFIEIIKIYNYCYNCANMLDLISNENKFISCDTERCINICNSLLLDDTITQEFQKYKNTPNMSVLEFIIKTSYWAVTSNRYDVIYKPYPLHIENIAKTGTGTMNVTGETYHDLILNFITKFPIKKILEILKKYDSDLDLYNHIGEIGYSFIKFTIKSNNTMIYNGNLISSNDVYDIIKQNTPNYSNDEDNQLINDIGDNIENLVQFSVVHSQQVENKFKKAKTTCYLYHGSKQENWYSIMRNGLKVGSNDNKLLINGAVHGNGIYLSNAINFSLTYSNSENIIIGVCQVMETREKWKKAENIYVIPDEKNVILKYLLVLNNTQSRNTFNNYMMNILDHKFNSSIHTENATKQNQVSTLRNKRLMKEYKTLVEQPTSQLGFKINLPSQDSLELWHIAIQSDGFEGNPKIQEDMKKYNIKEVILEFRFNENYPVQPPFVRILSPRFIYRTGHITLGGSICMELLTNQGWDITTSVSTVITYVKSAILEGEGQIDPNSRNGYTLEEAQDAFNRMLKSHGWL